MIGTAASLGFYVYSIYHRRPQPRTGAYAEIEEAVLSPDTDCKLGITYSADNPCPVGPACRGVTEFNIACTKRDLAVGHLHGDCIGSTARLYRVQAVTSIP